jgi:glycosyltransferase involved in cell wall biosynthesis
MADNPTMTGWPRVAVISDEPPQTGTAGGLLLHRLFADCPADRLRALVRYVPPIGEPLPGEPYRHLPVPWQRFEKSRFNRWKRSMRAVGLVPSVAPGLVDGLLGDFKPEVVVSVMQHAVYFDAALHYARSKGLPLVAIIHDVNEEFEPVLKGFLPAARRRDAAFYRYASRRLNISREMEQFCRETYGVPGSVMYPNRALDLTARALDDSASLKNPSSFTLGFAGNMNYGYGEGMLEMLPVLRETGTKVVAFGKEPSGKAAEILAAKDCFDFRGFVPNAEAWNAIKRECDAVWLPYTRSNTAMETLYSCHFPSKLPEYAALGMPVIVTGPEYATGLHWARRNLGPELAASDPVEFRGVLRALASNSAKRRDLAERCLDAGQRDFEPRKIVADFIGHLRGAVSGEPPA